MKCTIPLQGRLREGLFLKRLTRFSAAVKLEVNHRKEVCFLPNSGRLEELLKPGRRVILAEAACSKGRKTRYTLVGVVLPGGVKVSVDARLPNQVVAEALSRGLLEEFRGYRIIRSEPRFRGSRFDFLLADSSGGECWVEVKSCTLVRERVALFPDAPTERGRRHVKELTETLEMGHRACLVFVVQREDAEVFTANSAADPRFAASLREAALGGLEVYAYSARFTGRELELIGRIRVAL
ncbi:DNA/RNA nuclease SfsA [Candidatus Hecatella orcuttiae]|uniref:DNA/RNA nuclease SfsA n=1 Tax=Candidatus Hecatella orcuttiae TaxID=1935119 RepID=UPI0028683A0E|nr:DNA/RNA nuclease SfsA [Candidatus Hecatella orcuttiae]